MKCIDSYRIINIVFAGVIGLVFIYSCFFAPDEGKYLLPSFYPNVASPSLGLSRAFSAIVRGDIALANQFNPQGLNVFIFFCFQFLLRLISLKVDNFNFVRRRVWIRLDVILSISLFFITFKQFIHFTLSTIVVLLNSFF